jgi:hypothetical protein
LDHVEGSCFLYQATDIWKRGFLNVLHDVAGEALFPWHLSSAAAAAASLSDAQRDAAAAAVKLLHSEVASDADGHVIGCPQNVERACC